MAVSFNSNFPLNYEEAIFQLLLKNGKLQCKMNSSVNQARIVKNKTLDLAPLPSGKPLTKGKPIFDIKRTSDGSIERYKARYVAKGYLSLLFFFSFQC